jgi:hypothetical protein
MQPESPVKFDAAFLDRRMREHREWQDRTMLEIEGEVIEEVFAAVTSDRGRSLLTKVFAAQAAEGKPSRQPRLACRCDLRIRRGKEVAENRQSH